MYLEVQNVVVSQISFYEPNQKMILASPFFNTNTVNAVRVNNI